MPTSERSAKARAAEEKILNTNIEILNNIKYLILKFINCFGFRASDLEFFLQLLRIIADYIFLEVVCQ